LPLSFALLLLCFPPLGLQLVHPVFGVFERLGRIAHLLDRLLELYGSSAALLKSFVDPFLPFSRIPLFPAPALFDFLDLRVELSELTYRFVQLLPWLS
jgi:hypothetical protein